MMRRVGRDDRARRDRQRPIDAIGAERRSAVVEVDGIGPARAGTAGYGIVSVTHEINESVGTTAATKRVIAQAAGDDVVVAVTGERVVVSRPRDVLDSREGVGAGVDGVLRGADAQVDGNTGGGG